MNEEEFSELSAKVLVGDASSEEQEMHKSACEQNADFKASFEEMKVASGILEENAPLASSMDATEPQIPEFLLEKLVGEVGERNISNDQVSEEPVNTKSNLTSFWKYAAMPLAAAFAFALYINKGSEPTGGPAVSNEFAAVSEPAGAKTESSKPALTSEPFSTPAESTEPVYASKPISAPLEGYELAYTNIRATSISGPTSGTPEYEIASMGVQFGSWQEGVVRGGDDSGSWLPSAIKPAFYNNKKERAKWIQTQSQSIRVWIDEDAAKLMIFRPWAESPSSIELLPDSAGQRGQLIQLLNQLSFPSNGVKYIVSENDTLDGISDALNSRADWIIHANGLDKNLPLEQGITLFVPQAD